MMGVLTKPGGSGLRMSAAVTIFTYAPNRGRLPAWPFSLAALVATLSASPAAPADEPLPRVAVHEIQTDRVRLKPEILRVLRRYMANGLMAAGGFRLVPEDKLREALMKIVKDSRKKCFAESCWIEVGEALSADRAMTTRVMKLGGRCVVTAALYNVKTQVSERGGRFVGGCTESALTTSFDRVLRQITGKKPDPSPVEPGGGGPGPGGSGFKVEGAEVARPVARLIVQVKPRTARVKVTGPGGFSSTGGWNWERQDLAPGNYRVVAGAKGYVNSERSVELSVDDLKTVRIELERPGNLHVVGSPPGARVELTGPGGISLVKGLPVKVKGAPAGTYRVKVSRQGYRGEDRDAVVRAGATTKVEVKLDKEASAVTGGKAGLVWIRIPGGRFRMGSTEGPADEKPVHDVQVSSFSLLKSEVTVGQYGVCVKAGQCSAPGTDSSYCNWNKPGRGKHPVNCVDWQQARAFCGWAGGRLPSESEWEYAARSGGKAWKYPWGNAAATCGRAVMDDGKTKGSAGKETDGCGEDRTWPVCSKRAGNSTQGVCDLAGNVWEWVEDCWHSSYAGAPSRSKAWTSNCSDSRRVGRGGSWFSPAGGLRAASRHGLTPGYRGYRLGFRCAR